MRFLVLVAGGCAILIYMLVQSPEQDSMGKVDAVVPSAAASANNTITTIEDQVAADAIADYRLIEMGRSSAERCRRAREAAEALSRTQNDASYERWKETEQRECAAAERNRP